MSKSVEYIYHVTHGIRFLRSSSSINGRSDQAEEEDKEVGEQDAKGNKNVDGQEEDTAESRTDTIQEGEVVEGGEERSLGGEGKIDGEPAQQHGLDNDSEAKQGEKEKDKKPAVPLAFKIEMDLGLDTRYASSWLGGERTGRNRGEVGSYRLGVHVQIDNMPVTIK